MESNQQATEKKNITLFRILDKKKQQSPDYNGSVELPIGAGLFKEAKEGAKVCDVLMWRGMFGTKKRFTGLFIYTDEVAEVLGKAQDRFSFLITHESDTPENNAPNLKGFLRTDAGEGFRVSLWAREHENVNGGIYYSGSMEPEADMSKEGGF